MKKLGAYLLCVMFSLFLTAVTATAQTPVPPPFAVLAGTGITNTGVTTITGITGDVGSYPTLTQTGFSGANTLTIIGGTNHFGDGTTQGAKTDLVTAYNVAAGRGATQVATELGGQSLTAGVYNSAAGTFGITGTLTLNGGLNDVFIFKAASTLITAAGAPGLPASLVVLNGIQPCNVFWQVGSSATLGTYSVFQGNILALTSITATTGAKVTGRLLARDGAVTLDTNTITASACAVAPPPPPALTLTCPANAGQAGVAYSSTAVASGGLPPYTFSLTSGALPAGMTLNTATGAITGTPTAAGSFSVKVTDSRGTTSSSCAITIAAAPPPLVLTCPANAGQAGVAYSSTAVASGGVPPYTFSLASGALPAGMFLNTTTGAITGTPTTPGTFTVKVTDSRGTPSSSCGITIGAAPPPALALTCPVSTGQVGVAYSSTVVASGGVQPYSFSAAFGGTLTTGLTLNTATGAITGTPTTPGSGSFTVRVTDSGGTGTNSSCAITIAAATAPPPIALNCPANAGQVAVAYSSTAVASGGVPPYTFSVASGALTPGLTLNTATGAIMGKPTTPGPFIFTMRVTDSGGTGTNAPCGMTIAAAGAVTPPPASLLPDLTITKSHVGNFQQGGTGSYTLVASNVGPGATAGTVTVSDTLPAGLTARAISGTGWNCTLSFLSCTRSDTLAAGASYAPITVTVNVASNLLIGSSGGNGLTFQPDDILLSMKDGTVQWRHSDWTLVKIITSSTDGQAKGMALDASGNLFVTHYFGTGLSGNDVMKFDPNGNLIGLFGSSTYDCNPSSIVFDKSGNVYVGHADCSGNIFKLDSHGNLLARYNVAVENRGSSHILLGPDQCTMYYTSEATNVKRFNVCTNTQMPDFNTAPLPEGIDGAHQFTMLPGGGLLVADFSVIARLDASGNLVRTYNAPADTHCWLGLALDTDGTSFWASNWCDSSATRFDMATGNAIERHVAANTSFMVKQIMIVPPSPSSSVVINTAAVSGGGETNISNDSASDSTTIVTQSQAPVLSVNSTAFCAGAAWSMGVTNAVHNTALSLMGTTNGQSWMVAPWATTDANGSLSRAGTFADGTQGSYTLRVNDGKVSNTVYFVVSNCGP